MVHSLILAAGGLLSPEKLIDKGGLALVTAIIFAETGLLIGFFLPGDSLLFIAGFFASKPKGLPHLPVRNAQRLHREVKSVMQPAVAVSR